MMWFRLQSGRLSIAGVVLLAASTLASAAPIAVEATVTSVGPLFHYDYSITNNTVDDPFVIDVTVPMSATAVLNLMAPAGFQIAFDSALGLVSFIEDGALFTTIPTSGFSFDSTGGPGPGVFNATVFSSASGVYNLTGPTVSPTAVPEPGTASVLTGFVILALYVPLRRRRNALRSSPESQTN